MALILNGSNQYGLVDLGALTSGSDQTYFVIAKSEALDFECIFGLQSSSIASKSVGVFQFNGNLFGRYFPQHFQVDLESASAVSATYSKLLVKWKESTSTLTIQVDENAPETISGSPTDSNLQGLTVGARFSSTGLSNPSAFFTGALAHAAMWRDTELTGADVSDLMSGAKKPNELSISPTHYKPFVTDQTGGIGADYTLFNTPTIDSEDPYGSGVTTDYGLSLEAGSFSLSGSSLALAASILTKLNPDYALVSNIIKAYRKEAVSTMTDQIGSNHLDWSKEEWREPAIISGSASPQQGITRNASHWFGSSSSNIQKYDLSWSNVASNLSPYTGIAGSQNHIGDGFVDGLFYYLPVVNYDSGTQTATDVVIAKYNISDLSLASYLDVTASGFYGSGLTLSPDGTEILGTNYNRTVGSNKLYRFNLSTLSFIGTYDLPFNVMGMQGITVSSTEIYISSDDRDNTERNLIFVFDTVRNHVNTIVSKGIMQSSATNEIEGVCYYDGELYTHLINGNIRRLDANAIYSDANVASPIKFMDAPLGQGTILMRVTPKTFFDFNSLIDNQESENNWESWLYADGRIGWRVNNTSKTESALSPANAEYIVALTWLNSGGTVTTRLGVNGVFDDSASGAWIAPPANGLYLAGYNDKNDLGNNIYRDVTVYDKALSDAEFSSVSGNYDQIYKPAPASFEIMAEPGGYSSVGSSAILKSSRLLTSSNGDLILTGTLPDLKANRSLVSGVGSSALTGQDLTLTHGSAQIGYSLTAFSGSFYYTGSSFGLDLIRGLQADSSSFSMAGSNIEFKYSGLSFTTPDTRLFNVLSENRFCIVLN